MLAATRSKQLAATRSEHLAKTRGRSAKTMVVSYLSARVCVPEKEERSECQNKRVKPLILALCTPFIIPSFGSFRKEVLYEYCMDLCYSIKTEFTLKCSHHNMS